MPVCFCSLYPTIRCIIGATEIFIQMPSNPTAQQLTFSNYKNHNIFKSISWHYTIRSSLLCVRSLWRKYTYVSDEKVVIESGLLQLLEFGDSIMADRGFMIDDILPPGVELNIPPMLNEKGQITGDEQTTT